MKCLEALIHDKSLLEKDALMQQNQKKSIEFRVKILPFFSRCKRYCSSDNDY